MDDTGNRFSRLLSPGSSSVILAGLILLAWFPSLFGEFVYDDLRFVRDNEAIREITPHRVGTFFTDPRSVASFGWRGIYRPLRTLDFAIDWVLSGGRPWFFHLKNLLWHALGTFLVLLFLRQLFDDPAEKTDERAFLFSPAWIGAAIFAIHPVQSETVAFITSRGDLLLLVFFLAALLLHMRNRPVLASLVIVVAMFSKEAAVVFPAAALLVDVYRKRKPRWVQYAAYGVLSIAYVGLWTLLLADGSPERVGHMDFWWGGSYPRNLLTMAKGALLYFRLIVLPVDLAIDYHIPPSFSFGIGEAAAVAFLAVILAVGLRHRRARFALGWFLLTMLPTSNLLVPIGIPTAERFLYLPLVGVVFLVAPWFARTRLTLVVLGCFLVLSFARSAVWRTNESLFADVSKRVASPRTIAHLLQKEVDLALEAWDSRKTVSPRHRPEIHGRIEEHARAVRAYRTELEALYLNVLRVPPDILLGESLAREANVLVMLGELRSDPRLYREAIRVGERAASLGAGKFGHYNAALAWKRLGAHARAAEALLEAKAAGHTESLEPQAANLYLLAAQEAEEAGRLGEALELYRRAFDALPDRDRNRPALEGIRRLTR